VTGPANVEETDHEQRGGHAERRAHGHPVDQGGRRSADRSQTAPGTHHDVRDGPGP
jgi:hypothetical protein